MQFFTLSALYDACLPTAALQRKVFALLLFSVCFRSHGVTQYCCFVVSQKDTRFSFGLVPWDIWMFVKDLSHLCAVNIVLHMVNTVDLIWCLNLNSRYNEEKERIHQVKQSTTNTQHKWTTVSWLANLWRFLQPANVELFCNFFPQASLTNCKGKLVIISASSIWHKMPLAEMFDALNEN